MASKNNLHSKLQIRCTFITCTLLFAVSPLTKLGPLQKTFRFISSGSAYAQGSTSVDFSDAELINQGRDIFFNETFNGNGRTCGTCHPETNNFTIDPKFIATLPADDPLFVAERPAPNPLSENFEKPELMRKAGLILENTNGFDDLQNNFTMRSVPHLFALRTSITPPTESANDGTTLPPDERTGWSGDGSPIDLNVDPQLRGTLRDFTVGAVIQHFPKTLNRAAGEYFRLPTQSELDALEAFIFSLGRQKEFDDLATITLTNKTADRGRLNFLVRVCPKAALPATPATSMPAPIPIPISIFQQM